MPSRRSSLRPLVFDRKVPDGLAVFGVSVACFAKEPESDGTRWVELAYTVSMVESDVSLSREDFERVVANFARYPCVPVVIEHADTDWFPKVPSWAEPHGYIEEMRIGEREVTEMDGSVRTASTLEGRVRFDAATGAEVGPTRKWRFGSITLFKGVKDEATGAGLGALLWSWSLTAHPRLMGLQPIAAHLDASALDDGQRARLAQLVAALQGIAPGTTTTTNTTPAAATPTGATPTTATTDRGTRDASATTTTPEPTTMKYLELAAKLGLTATSEEDARERVLAFTHLGADAVRALGLTPAATAQEVAARVSSITTAAARVPELERERDALRTERDARRATEREAYFDELFAVQPELRAAEGALRFHAERDWDAFVKIHPRPTAQELLQAAQHPQRLAPIVTPGAPAPAHASLAQGEVAPLLASAVRTHLCAARAEGRELTFTDAVHELGSALQF